jgi:luciferase family oxidoreductase group 1
MDTTSKPSAISRNSKLAKHLETKTVLSFSVLDQSIANAGEPPGQAIRNTLALAQAVDTLGYKRFWVSEHHNNPAIVGTAPEVLIGAIAATTSHIRVGSAGVMLPHYSPFKVAEQFRVLDAIAPGRIDIGLGRAPGSDGRTAYALNPLANERPAQFPNDVRDLQAWLSGSALSEGHPFANVKANPAGETTPEMWILGSSDYGAQVAAHFGLPYAFAWFFTDGQGGAEAMQIYRSTYQPSARHPMPCSALCVWALAAETTDEAHHQFMSRARFRLLRDRGVFGPIESPVDAEAHTYSPQDRQKLDGYKHAAMIGTGVEVAAKIVALAEQLNVAEIAIVTWAFDEHVRHKSYRLIADALGLANPPRRAAPSR